jgi:hypothetical protein
MSYIPQILNKLGKNLSDIIGKPLNTTNYKRYGTIEQYRDFCIDNWDILEAVYDNLIGLEEFEELTQQNNFSKWHYFSLIVGRPEDEFLQQ